VGNGVTRDKLLLLKELGIPLGNDKSDPTGGREIMKQISKAIKERTQLHWGSDTILGKRIPTIMRVIV
jgi:hypothetical protein